MGKTELYLNIPDKLYIGFEDKDDKLSYVTYQKKDGSIAKENSWNSWRNPDIEPLELKNSPISGITIRGGGGGHRWSRRQAYCQIIDPRGFECQISYENLLFILNLYTYTKNADTGNNQFDGEFVYAWDGQSLVLCPTESDDYKFTKTIDAQKQYSPNECTVGYSYTNPKYPKYTYIYLGEYLCPTYKSDYIVRTGTYEYKYNIIKRHLFAFINENNIVKITDYNKSTVTKFVLTDDSICEHVDDYVKQYYNSVTGKEDIITNKKFNIKKFDISNITHKSYKYGDLDVICKPDDITDSIIKYGYDMNIANKYISDTNPLHYTSFDAINEDKTTIVSGSLKVVLYITDNTGNITRNTANDVYKYPTYYGLSDNPDEIKEYILNHSKYRIEYTIYGITYIQDNKVMDQRCYNSNKNFDFSNYNFYINVKDFRHFITLQLDNNKQLYYTF